MVAATVNNAATSMDMSIGQSASSINFMQYNRSNLLYVDDFCNLLIAQGKVHGYEMSRDRAEVVANRAGREFDVTFLSVGINNIKGMMTSTNASSFNGPVVKLEDIIVYDTERKQGYGTKLFDKLLLDAWENEFLGVTWTTARSNLPAHRLFRKYDSTFNAEALSSVWRLSAEQCTRLADQHQNARGAKAVLAEDKHLSKIAQTAKALTPYDDIGHLSSIIRGHANHFFRAFLVVVPETGSFAVASLGQSTFNGCERISLIPYFMQPDSAGNGWKNDMRRMTSAVCAQRSIRGIAGDMEIEFLNSTNQHNEKFKAKVKNELEEAGGDYLTHENSRMVAYELAGMRYVQAVDVAATRLPENPLSKRADGRLRKALKEYGAASPT